MNEIVSAAKARLDEISYAPIGKNYKTNDVRKLSAMLFKDVKDKPLEHVLTVCEELLEQRRWAMGVIAYDFAYRMKDQYDGNTFDVFEGWLEKYVRGWGDCDDFCTHAFGELICQNTKLTEKTIAWTKRNEFWMRRAAAVVLLLPIGKDKHKEINPLRVSDILMNDEHHLVLKGYGWMLKALSTKKPELVFNYLIKNRAVMPRVAYRYALEKMDADKKRVLMH